MSHFVKCDRCGVRDNVTGTLSLPPGWLKVLGADLCELCCQLVREFIHFRPGDADRLPTEPIPESVNGKSSDKLFEEKETHEPSENSHH